MVKTTPDTIILKGEGTQKEGLVKTGQTITPGMLIEHDSGGVKVHATAAGNAAPSFAVENEQLGDTIDTDYAAGETCYWKQLESGSEVYALVAAGAAAIVDGDYLESAGDGTLRVLTAAAATTQAQRASVVARAIEAVDNSGGATVARIKVEVM